MENLKDSMNGEEKKIRFFRHVQFEMLSGLPSEKSKLGVWCLGYISKQKIKVWELLAYRCFQR